MQESPDLPANEIAHLDGRYVAGQSFDRLRPLPFSPLITTLAAAVRAEVSGAPPRFNLEALFAPGALPGLLPLERALPPMIWLSLHRHVRNGVTKSEFQSPFLWISLPTLPARRSSPRFPSAADVSQRDRRAREEGRSLDGRHVWPDRMITIVSGSGFPSSSSDH